MIHPIIIMAVTCGTFGYYTGRRLDFWCSVRIWIVVIKALKRHKELVNSMNENETKCVTPTTNRNESYKRERQRDRQTDRGREGGTERVRE